MIWRVIASVTCGIVFLGLHPAAAQEYIPSPAISKLGAYLETMPDLMAAAQRGAFETDRQLQARIRQLETRIRDLEAYAKACGDKPGCFVPAPSP